MQNSLFLIFSNLKEINTNILFLEKKGWGIWSVDGKDEGKKMMCPAPLLYTVVLILYKYFL
jgi:hypothetical protein